jgi:O-antigen ligase
VTDLGDRALVMPLTVSEPITSELDDEIAALEAMNTRLAQENHKGTLRDPVALRPKPRMPVATYAAMVYIAGLPLLRPSGPGNTSPVDIAGLVLLVAVGSSWLTRRLAWRLPFAVPMSVFALGGVLGALAGPAPGHGLTAVVQDLVLLLVCGCIVSTARTADTQRLLLRTWAVSGIVWAALLIVGVAAHIGFLSGDQLRFGVRASLTTGDPNLAANYLVASLFVMYAARMPVHRPGRVLATIVVFVATLLTGSNGAIAALVVGTLVTAVAAICIRRGWRVGVGLVALAAAITLLVGVAPISQWQQQLVNAARNSSVQIVRDSVGRQDQSSSTRRTLLDESLELFRTDGPFGTGPGSTKLLLETRQYAYQKEAHDDYLAALTERGVLGVLGLGLLFGAGVARLSRLSRLYPDISSRRVPRPAPMIGCAFALATSGMFYEVLHFRQVWVYLALLAAVSLPSDGGRWAARFGRRR